MTISIILGREHGSDDITVVRGPGNPEEVNGQFNAMTLTDGDGLAEIYLHELMLTGGRKQKTFPEPR
jgi:hypothetical protein